jgi:hypothetical protein
VVQQARGKAGGTDLDESSFVCERYTEGDSNTEAVVNWRRRFIPGPERMATLLVNNLDTRLLGVNSSVSAAEQSLQAGGVDEPLHARHVSRQGHGRNHSVSLASSGGCQRSSKWKQPS